MQMINLISPWQPQALVTTCWHLSEQEAGETERMNAYASLSYILCYRAAGGAGRGRRCRSSNEAMSRFTWLWACSSFTGAKAKVIRTPYSFMILLALDMHYYQSGIRRQYLLLDIFIEREKIRDYNAYCSRNRWIFKNSETFSIGSFLSLSREGTNGVCEVVVGGGGYTYTHMHWKEI